MLVYSLVDKDVKYVQRWRARRSLRLANIPELLIIFPATCAQARQATMGAFRVFDIPSFKDSARKKGFGVGCDALPGVGKQPPLIEFCFLGSRLVRSINLPLQRRKRL